MNKEKIQNLVCEELVEHIASLLEKGLIRAEQVQELAPMIEKAMNVRLAEENKNEETKQEEDNKNTQDENKVPLLSGTNDNNNNKTPKDKGTISIQGLLNILGLLLALLALAFIIIVLAKRKNNVKIYIEEGDEKVLVGKEKVTKDNRELDLNKYYNKYKEDEYKIVLSKSISKKLDKKTVNLTVHDKKESFVVDYDSKEYIYRT